MAAVESTLDIAVHEKDMGDSVTTFSLNSLAVSSLPMMTMIKEVMNLPIILKERGRMDWAERKVSLKPNHSTRTMMLST